MSVERVVAATGETIGLLKAWLRRCRRAFHLAGEWLALVLFRAIAVYALAVVISLAFIALERAATAAPLPAGDKVGDGAWAPGAQGYTRTM
jgi:hypothetical protein